MWSENEQGYILRQPAHLQSFLFVQIIQIPSHLTMLHSSPIIPDQPHQYRSTHAAHA